MRQYSWPKLRLTNTLLSKCPHIEVIFNIYHRTDLKFYCHFEDDDSLWKRYGAGEGRTLPKDEHKERHDVLQVLPIASLFTYTLYSFDFDFDDAGDIDIVIHS